MKNKKIGRISFTEEGYEAFKLLSKNEQVKQVYESLSPKDMDKAEQLLKNIPNGNIAAGVQRKDAKDKPVDATGGSKRDSNEGRGANTEESKD